MQKYWLWLPRMPQKMRKPQKHTFKGAFIISISPVSQDLLQMAAAATPLLPPPPLPLPLPPRHHPLWDRPPVVDAKTASSMPWSLLMMVPLMVSEVRQYITWCYHNEEANLPITKKPAGSRPFDLSRTVLHDIGVTQYDLWEYNHSQDSMVVAGGLAPIWRQAICNNHEDVNQSAYIRSAKSNATDWYMQHVPPCSLSLN